MKLTNQSVGLNDDMTVSEYIESLVGSFSDINTKGKDHPIVSGISAKFSGDIVKDLQQMLMGKSMIKTYTGKAEIERDFDDGVFGAATAKGLNLWVQHDYFGKREDQTYQSDDKMGSVFHKPGYPPIKPSGDIIKRDRGIDQTTTNVPIEQR